jgi:hypothetical protein
MNHLPPGFGGLDQLLSVGNLRLLRDSDMSVATRPVRTSEAGVRQAHVGAHDHDDEAQRQRGEIDAGKPGHERTSGPQSERHRFILTVARPGAPAASSANRARSKSIRPNRTIGTFSVVAPRDNTVKIVV